MEDQVRRTSSRLDYIDSLALAVPDESLLGLDSSAGSHRLAETDKAAYVDAGSVLSFVGGVAVGKQADVLNSTLLAQLAANAAYDRETATEQWYQKYREVLENIGWVITSFSFVTYNESGATLRMDKAALSVIAAIASGNELAALTAALKALENADPSSKQVTLFDGNGSGGSNGNFQLASCSQDPNGNVQAALGAFYFKATKHEGRFLFWTWNTHSVDLYFGAQSVVLNEQIYATVRTAIVAKLGDRAVRYVADLDIGD